MRLPLLPHPQTPCLPVDGIEAEAVRLGACQLYLRYWVHGRIGELHIPAPAANVRTDALWRRTCFEAFVSAGAGPGYIELNMSPSSQWAAYQFDAYREGMAPLAKIAPPLIETYADDETLTVNVGLDLSRTALAQRRDWRLGLTAVIEDASGRLSYWSLAHGAGKPDFHHRDGFVLGLPTPETS